MAPNDQDQPRSVLADLGAAPVHPTLQEMLFNDIRGNTTRGEPVYENGDHRNSPLMMTIYEQYYPYITKVMDEKGLKVENDPILGPLSELDGMPGLSKEEIAAGMMALDALPNLQNRGRKGITLGAELGRYVNYNEKEKKIEDKPSKDTVRILGMGMKANINEDDLKLATQHMEAYLATAKQFLGDNYNVQLDEDTRHPASDEHYVRLMQFHAPSIRNAVDGKKR